MNAGSAMSAGGGGSVGPLGGAAAGGGCGAAFAAAGAAFAAAGASLIAHTGYFHLVQKYPVTSVAPLTTLSPVFSVIFGVSLLGDPMSLQIILGGLCTLVGVFIITMREKRIVDTGS